MAASIESIERIHLVLIGVSTAGAWLSGWLGAGSVVLGGAAMAANVWLLKNILRRVMTPETSQNPGVVLLLVLAKFSIFLGLLALLFWRVPLDPMAFAFGATLLMVACVASVFVGDDAVSSASE